MKSSPLSRKLFLISLIFAACVHELPIPTDPNTPTTPTTPPQAPDVGNCDPDSVYFVNDVLPIVASHCQSPGCHGATSPRGGFLLTTYSNIKSQFVSRSGQSRLVSRLNDMAEKNKSGYTPPTTTEQALIEKWISQGAKNNSCTAGCDSTNFAFAADVFPIFTQHCVGCHATATSSNLNVDLHDYASIKAEIVANPGNATNPPRLLGCIEWTSAYQGALQMPYNQTQLSKCNIAQIRQWIQAGYPQN